MYWNPADKMEIKGTVMGLQLSAARIVGSTRSGLLLHDSTQIFVFTVSTKTEKARVSGKARVLQQPRQFHQICERSWRRQQVV